MLYVYLALEVTTYVKYYMFITLCSEFQKCFYDRVATILFMLKGYWIQHKIIFSKGQKKL
jgi:hypothetical protein